MSKKTSKYQNDDGTFKEAQRPGSDHASAFNGCVLHMTHEEGHSEESAKKICGAIAQKVGAGKDVRDKKEVSDEAIGQAILAAPLNIAFEAGKPLPDNIQFMPPGRQKVTPLVNGEPREMEVNVSAKYADVFNQALQNLLAQAKAGQGDLPFTDFNHEDGAASSRPTGFYWGGEDPKTGGVRLRTAWTASGKSAIEGGDFARFSPQWVFHKKTFEPLGLPVNVGGLVNRAAFKTIAPIVSAADGGKKWALGAAQAADSDPENPECSDCGDLSAAAHKASSKAMTPAAGDEFNAHTAAFQAHKEAEAANRISGNDDLAEHHSEMMAFHKKKANQFAKQALAGSGEAASTTNQNKGNEMNEQEMATAMAKAVEAAIKPLTDKITALESGQKNEATARAKAAVQAHVQRGAIAPEEKLPDGQLLVDYYTQQMTANAAATEMTLSRLPSKGPRRTIVGAGTGGASEARYAPASPADAIIASAKDLRQKQPGSFVSDADALIAVCRTKDGYAKYQEFVDGVYKKTGNN